MSITRNQLRASELALESKRLKASRSVPGKLFSGMGLNIGKKIDIGWVVFIVSISLMFIWLIPHIVHTKTIPGFGFMISILLFAMVPLAVYTFITGGSFIEAILAIVLLISIMMFGNKIAVLQPIFSMISNSYTIGEPLKQGVMSLLSVV